MSFLNKILYAKDIAFRKKGKDGTVKTDTKKIDKANEAKEEIVQESVPKTRGKIIPGIIYAPHITEKSSQDSAENKYTFLVSPKANKVQIKQALEVRYGVDVETVRVISLPGKERKRGQQIGWKPGKKKAIVKVKEGQNIEIG